MKKTLLNSSYGGSLGARDEVRRVLNELGFNSTFFIHEWIHYSLFQMGKDAHAKGISMSAHDPDLMTWLQANTTGEVGSAIPHFQEWYRGFNSAVDAECKDILIS
ncbi:hypothetical protein MACH09_46680 [Vibrio sp. MACH09]|uniref:hypothetical protein n=1 Tax=Vibrio sp. MACH09 TaxID=3025122 RepID=UPI00278DFCEA|nr:hypothetical protein [Vibrio sp. MACH09]GLO64160.1 hypothetical protein MACH09_46680 [Vibrio sp. MACH09]